MWLDLLILLIFLLILGYFIRAFGSLAPPVPTRKQDYKRIKELAGLKDNEAFLDIGCGTGSFLKYLAKTNKNIYGIEINIVMYLWSHMNNALSKDKFRVLFGNAMKLDFSTYQVVYLFAAAPEFIKDDLIQKFKAELKPGSRIITYCFPIKDWQASQTSKPDSKSLKIYRYDI